MKGTFRLVKICGNFGSTVNGKRFVGSSTGKLPEKVENLKREALFLVGTFRTEFRVSFTRF